MPHSSKKTIKIQPAAPASHPMPRAGYRRWLIAVLVGVALAGGVLWWHYVAPKPAKQLTTRTPENVALADPDVALYTSYAGSESCKECHRTEYDRWASSHHGLAERRVKPQMDRPAFEPAQSIKLAGQTYAPDIAGSQYQITAADLSGGPRPQKVERVIGVDPLRQYLVAGTGGRWQAMEVAFDPNRKDWFDIFGSEGRQPGEWGHWTGRGMTWNSMCASCHNTRLRKNYDEPTDSYHTQMAEISVGCEACHGPMKSHVTQAKAPGAVPAHGATGPKFSRDQIIDTCGSCHARRTELTGDFVPGESFFNRYSLSGVDESDLFYPDGQIHDEVYEFSTFLGSKMHAAGVSCTDCHDVHSGKTILPGNALCMRCHAGAFPKAPVINPVLHTFHKPDSTGSQCVNCHMPQTAYMQRHLRHDHGFTTPDPLLTKQIGVPNACNRCHADRDADWARASATTWYGAKLDRPARHRALTVAAARKGDESARPELITLLGDPAQPPYWRSTFVHLLGQWADDRGTLATLSSTLHADHPMVRQSAVMALAPLAPNQPDIAAALQELTADPSQSVRIAAAHALGPSVSADSPAGRELLAMMQLQADQPTGQLQLAMYAAARQQPDQAIAHLQKTVDWDQHSAALRRDVAVLYGSLSRHDEALEQIRQACRLEPKNAEFEFLHGLAASEAAKQAEAIAAFEKSVLLDPHHARGWYNLAMADFDAGKVDPALNAIANAESSDPKNADYPYARATMLARIQRPADARAALKRVLALRPDYRDALDLLQRLSMPDN